MTQDRLMEQHLIIDWSNSLSSKIVTSHIQESGLTLTNVIHVPRLRYPVKTITEFYNVGFEVNDERGTTDFTVYLVDSPVVYDMRSTTKGDRLVNVKLFDLKQILRNLVTTQIHATDNIQETKCNLKVLGLYEKYYNEKKFDTLNDVFDELNKYPKLKWVITHNFDNFVEGDDIDFLTDDYYYFMCVLDTTERPKGGFLNSVSNGGKSVRNYIEVGEKNIPIDIRYLGDNFYDINLEKKMLNERISCKNFYIPEPNTYKYTLIYHALLHKPTISQTYIDIFNNLGLPTTRNDLADILDEYMTTKQFIYVRPNDMSVGWNMTRKKKFKGPRFEVSQKIVPFILRKPLNRTTNWNTVSHIDIDIHRTKVTKRFTGRYIKNFPGLFDREVYWLLKMEKFDRTPNYISHDRDKKTVTMSYVGEPLTKQNLPDDYEEQIQYILDGLKEYNCSHNDIKPSELMCMDGKINIIDFSWSTELDLPIPEQWPLELGDAMYRRGVHDFDDEYSIGKSIEHIINS